MNNLQKFCSNTSFYTLQSNYITKYIPIYTQYAMQYQYNVIEFAMMLIMHFYQIGYISVSRNNRPQR